MQPAPRPPPSVPLGGSLRASRAAQLARPNGPLSAVDLADGRALTVERLGAGWVVIPGVEDAAPPSRATAPERAAAVEAPARRRRHLGTGLALAAALGAAIVALASGFSGAPAPAVAGPTSRPPAARPAASRPVLHEAARGGRSAPLPRPTPRPAPSPPAAPAPPPVVAPPAARPAPPPAPPPLPELPSAPSL